MTEAVMGAVAYAPKVVTIWEGFKDCSRRTGCVRLHPLLELRRPGRGALRRQIPHRVELAARLDRADRIAAQWAPGRCGGDARHGPRLRALIVVRADAVPSSDLRGKTIGVGASDSPQATLIPLRTSPSHGLDPGAGR